MSTQVASFLLCILVAALSVSNFIGAVNVSKLERELADLKARVAKLEAKK